MGSGWDRGSKRAEASMEGGDMPVLFAMSAAATAAVSPGWKMLDAKLLEADILRLDRALR
jgi:hypothetical protein